MRVSASEASVTAAEATAAQYATALAGARHALDDSRAETAMLRGKLQALSSASTDAETLDALFAIPADGANTSAEGERGPGAAGALFGAPARASGLFGGGGGAPQQTPAHAHLPAL